MNKVNTCKHRWVNVPDGSLDQVCWDCGIKQVKCDNHTWVSVPDGSLDQICNICGIKQKRAAMMSAPAPIRFLTAKEGLEVGKAMAEGFRAGLEIAPMRVAAPILVDESTFTIFGTVNGPMTVKQSDFIRELNKEIYKNLGVNSSLLGGNSNSNK